jgi:hypothetical protein
LLGVEGNAYVMQDVFGYRQLGVDQRGVAFGEFYVTGYRPACLAQMEAAGVFLPPSLFEARKFPAPSAPMHDLPPAASDNRALPAEGSTPPAGEPEDLQLPESTLPWEPDQP